MVYIAYNREGYIVSIVAAKSYELATVYWQGLNLDYDTHKCLEQDFTPLSEHHTGVIPILKTESKKPISYNPSIAIIKVAK